MNSGFPARRNLSPSFLADGRMATFDFFSEKEKKKTKVAWPRTAFSLATQLGRRARGPEHEHTRVSTLQQLCYYFPKKKQLCYY